MKTRLLIISIIVILAGISIAFLIVDSFDIDSGQKYHYKFGETTVKNEKDEQFDRVFFSYSHDYGVTFSESQDISMSENTWTGESKMILMGKEVILVWREEVIPTHTLSFAKSVDYGKTLEKKYLWTGSRPDIVHYDDVLYLTWVDLETRQVIYTTSDDRGKIFGEHKVIFAPTNEFSPYALKPEPKFVIEEDTVKIIWNSPISLKGDPQDFKYVIGEDQPICHGGCDNVISMNSFAETGSYDLEENLCIGRDVDDDCKRLGKIREKDIPIFFEIQLMELGIEWESADKSWANPDFEIEPPARICSHIIKDSGAELYISTIWEDEYTLSDMIIQRQMPDDCVKFYHPTKIAKNEN